MGKKKSEETLDRDAQKAADREAVGKAIAALGQDADIKDMHEWIQTNCGFDIENKLIGIHRYHILPKPDAAKKVAKGKGKRQPVADDNGEAPKATSSKPDMIALTDIALIKQLVERYGHAPVRQLIDFAG